jgi:hypothetical protein
MVVSLFCRVAAVTASLLEQGHQDTAQGYREHSYLNPGDTGTLQSHDSVLEAWATIDPLDAVNEGVHLSLHLDLCCPHLDQQLFFGQTIFKSIHHVTPL